MNQLLQTPFHRSPYPSAASTTSTSTTFACSFPRPSLHHMSVSPPPPAAMGAMGVGLVSEGGDEKQQLMTARERRELRKERRSSKWSNWREEVEERLLYAKPKKKRYASWTEELNLDNLADLGPQWWVFRVSRVRHQETTDRLARSFVTNYPDFSFKLYNPAVMVKRKLKNGSVSVKAKPIFPGCVFLHCLMNKEIHDFVKEFDGIGGFLGSRVGNTKRQINRPKPVDAEEMEEVFKQAKEEQENADHEFDEQYPAEEISDGDIKSVSPRNAESADSKTKTKGRTRKNSASTDSNSLGKKYNESLVSGSNVRVLSGPFVEFTGCLKDLNHKSGKATVGFMLFGKESFVGLEIDQIVADAASSTNL